MRLVSCLALGLIASASVSEIASAQAFARGPGAVRPPVMAPRPGARPPSVIGAQLPPGPPLRPVYGPPQGYPGVVHPGPRVLDRQGGRFVPYAWRNAAYGNYWGNGGFGYVVNVDTGPAARIVAAPDAGARTVIYNVPAPPLSQGDIGYVAKPAIYDVGAILRKRATGVVK
jgi:hypothetical protein